MGPPIEQGWYLACLKKQSTREIVEVDEHQGTLRVWMVSDETPHQVDEFDWLGQISLDQINDPSKSHPRRSKALVSTPVAAEVSASFELHVKVPLESHTRRYRQDGHDFLSETIPHVAVPVSDKCVEIILSSFTMMEQELLQEDGTVSVGMVYLRRRDTLASWEKEDSRTISICLNPDA